MKTCRRKSFSEQKMKNNLVIKKSAVFYRAFLFRIESPRYWFSSKTCCRISQTVLGCLPKPDAFVTIENMKKAEERGRILDGGRAVYDIWEKKAEGCLAGNLVFCGFICSSVCVFWIGLCNDGIGVYDLISDSESTGKFNSIFGCFICA